MKKSHRPVEALERVSRSQSRLPGGWQLVLPVDPAETQPLFVRIARAISADIRRGRLPAGTCMPGSRSLAGTLAVHRNTVLAAYRELLAEGFLETRAGRGTYVASTLPEQSPRRFAPASQHGQRTSDASFALPTIATPYSPIPVGTLALLGGIPDVRLLPSQALARAYRRALRQPNVLHYGDPAGQLSLRRGLADMLRASRGLAIDADDIVVTRGSQMALALIARVLITPGDVVAVERLGYPPAWQAFRAAGAQLAPLPIDEHGLSIDALEQLCEQQRVRAVYLTPHHQYPTTVALSAPRRLALLALARKHGVAIIEDDYHHEFQYEGRPILPLRSADSGGSVIYIGTLSKVLAPALRIGYVVGPARLLTAIAAARMYIDRQGDQLTESAVGELMEDGEVQRHVRRTRRIYHARRDHCVALLEKHFGDELQLKLPSGGMALWLRVPSTWSVERLLTAAREEGVLFQPGKYFNFEDRPLPWLRLGYAGLDERELAEALRRLARARTRAGF